jgi:hypothetical protein
LFHFLFLKTTKNINNNLVFCRKMLKKNLFLRGEDQVSLRGKNSNLKRECDFYTKCLANDLRRDFYADSKRASALRASWSKLNDFKRFQYDTELNCQSSGLDELIDSYIEKRSKESDPKAKGSRAGPKAVRINEYKDIDKSKVNMLLKERIKTGLSENFRLFPSLSHTLPKTARTIKSKATSTAKYSNVSLFDGLSDYTDETLSTTETKSKSTIDPYSFWSYKKLATFVDENRISDDLYTKNFKPKTVRRLSVVVGIKPNRYLIYKFEKDGFFDKSSVQPEPVNISKRYFKELKMGYLLLFILVFFL